MSQGNTFPLNFGSFSELSYDIMHSQSRNTCLCSFLPTGTFETKNLAHGESHRRMIPFYQPCCNLDLLNLISRYLKSVLLIRYWYFCQMILGFHSASEEAWERTRILYKISKAVAIVFNLRWVTRLDSHLNLSSFKGFPRFAQWTHQEVYLIPILYSVPYTHCRSTKWMDSLALANI